MITIDKAIYGTLDWFQIACGAGHRAHWNELWILIVIDRYTFVSSNVGWLSWFSVTVGWIIMWFSNTHTLIHGACAWLPALGFSLSSGLSKMPSVLLFHNQQKVFLFMKNWWRFACFSFLVIIRWNLCVQVYQDHIIELSEYIKHILGVPRNS